MEDPRVSTRRNSDSPATASRPALRLGDVLPLALIALFFVIVATLLLLFPLFPAGRFYDLSEGDIAPEDITSPREVTYVSQIETQSAREAAAASVNDIYDPPDPRIGRQQVRRARQIMDFAVDVRADTMADTSLKSAYLDQIKAIQLSTQSSSMLLALSDTQFDQLEREVVKLIEWAMSGAVKEGRVDEVSGQLPLKVSTDLPDELLPLAVAIARDLIVPNSVLNISATEQARADAVSSVPEIRQTFRAGEIVIRAGEPVTALDLEALNALGLASKRLTVQEIASAILASLLSAVILSVYLVAFNPSWLGQPGHLLMLTALFLLFLAGAQVMIPGHLTLAYLFPAAALALALAALMGTEIAVLATVVLAILAALLADPGGSLEIAIYLMVSGLLAIASLRRKVRLNAYFFAGIFASIGGAAVLLIFRLPLRGDPLRLAQLLLTALGNGLLSSGIALVILFVIGSLTSLLTNLQLLDLLRPDHPLQRRLQREALGTYQHTLSVANLAEAAAEAIGANSLLARVGTLYHDIGKTTNPGFFVENRTEGSPDPHESLSPAASARIIKSHVEDGLDLAHRHRLPVQVIAFINEHHGTMPIIFFLDKAREQAAEAGVALDERLYFYDGPPPQSRETAILMLADGCEGAVRANRPATREEIEEIVMRIIQKRIDLHQLDESNLTLKDIKTIQNTFVRTLRGMYHPRIKYPGDEKPARLVSGEGPSVLPSGDAVVEGKAVPAPGAEVSKGTISLESGDASQKS